MKLNSPLTLNQKIEIFLNLPGIKVGLFIFSFLIFMAALFFTGNDAQGKSASIIFFFFLPFAMIGLYLIYPGFRALPRIFNALENGVCVEGQLLEIKSTNEKINDQPLKILKLGYKLYDELYICEERFLKPVKNIKRHLLMVDASDPENAVYIEKLPERVKLDLIRRNYF